MQLLRASSSATKPSLSLPSPSNRFCLLPSLGAVRWDWEFVKSVTGRALLPYLPSSPCWDGNGCWKDISWHPCSCDCCQNPPSVPSRASGAPTKPQVWVSKGTGPKVRCQVEFCFCHLLEWDVFSPCVWRAFRVKNNPVIICTPDRSKLTSKPAE